MCATIHFCHTKSVPMLLHVYGINRVPTAEWMYICIYKRQTECTKTEAENRIKNTCVIPFCSLRHSAFHKVHILLKPIENVLLWFDGVSWHSFDMNGGRWGTNKNVKWTTTSTHQKNYYPLHKQNSFIFLVLLSLINRNANCIPFCQLSHFVRVAWVRNSRQTNSEQYNEIERKMN